MERRIAFPFPKIDFNRDHGKSKIPANAVLQILDVHRRKVLDSVDEQKNPYGIHPDLSTVVHLVMSGFRGGWYFSPHALMAVFNCAVSIRLLFCLQTAHTESRSLLMFFPSFAEIGISGANDKIGNRYLVLSSMAFSWFCGPCSRSILFNTRIIPGPYEPPDWQSSCLAPISLPRCRPSEARHPIPRSL